MTNICSSIYISLHIETQRSHLVSHDIPFLIVSNQKLSVCVCIDKVSKPKSTIKPLQGNLIEFSSNRFSCIQIAPQITQNQAFSCTDPCINYLN